MLYASFASSCQQLFSKFFQEALRPALPCLPRRLRGSGIASARCWFMPKSAGIVKHFFEVFPNFFRYGLQYAGFVGYLFQLTAVAPHSLAYGTGLGDEFTINIR